jgi:hypothetical protein
MKITQTILLLLALFLAGCLAHLLGMPAPEGKLLVNYPYVGSGLLFVFSFGLLCGAYTILNAFKK